MKIKLIVDSACDLPISYINENNIDFVSLEVNIKGKFFKDDFGKTISYDDFYALLRNGEMTSTSQVNVFTFEEKFESYVKEGYSIIYIGLSSALSGTVSSAIKARENLSEKYSHTDISIIDSKSVSLGIGALVYYANDMIKNGKEKECIVRWLESNTLKINHAIVLNDLIHLKRGGRISGTSATVGTLLNIKPSLIVDKQGKVVPGSKIKGRKKALKYIINEIKEKGLDLNNQVLFIAHADCLEEAKELKEMILLEVNVKDIIINSIGTVIGTHGGPGTLAAIFLGKERE